MINCERVMRKAVGVSVTSKALEANLESLRVGIENTFYYRDAYSDDPKAIQNSAEELFRATALAAIKNLRKRIDQLEEAVNNDEEEDEYI